MSIFIIAIILYIGYKVLKFLKNASSNSVDSSSQHQQQSANAEQIHSFNQFYPFIDSIINFALENNQSWTTEKVRYIKWLFRDALQDEQNLIALQTRLKQRPNIPQHQLLHYLSDQIADSEEREYIVAVYANIFRMNGNPEDVIRKRIINLAHIFKLSQYHIDNIFQIVFEQHQNKNSSHDDEAHQRFADHTKHQDKDKIVWACNILGLQFKDLNKNQISLAYRSKIKDFHPDRNQNVTPAVQQLLIEKAQHLNQARDILFDYVKSHSSGEFFE